MSQVKNTVKRVYIVISASGLEVSRHHAKRIAEVVASEIGGSVQCYKVEQHR